VNCNLCEMICPDFAIYSVAVPDSDDGPERESASGTDDAARTSERGGANERESH